jgi:hypothetical protein
MGDEAVEWNGSVASLAKDSWGDDDAVNDFALVGSAW